MVKRIGFWKDFQDASVEEINKKTTKVTKPM